MFLVKMMLIKHIIILEKILDKLLLKNGGTMPEELPTPKKSLKELEKENKCKLISNIKNN